jgi:signal transduction histidine kinase
MKQIFSNKFLFLCALAFGAALTRLLPHYPNFTAIGGLALFGGAYFEKKWEAFLIPFLAMFATDLLIGFHSTMFAVYASFFAIILIGMSLRKKKTFTTVALGTVSASVLFFIVTNFAMWATGTMYPKNLAGIAECYTAAIPFFGSTLSGDILFTAILFGTYELLRRKAPSLVYARIK